MAIIIPKKLKKGDEIRVITPARSIKIPFITQEVIKNGIKNLEQLGLKVSFGKHVEEINSFNSSSIKSRVEDIHDAFSDNNVKGIITVIGGYNSNQLLEHLDYELIKKNPKILVGYSDITALQNAIFKKTNMITYSGPHFFSFGSQKDLSYINDYFIKCLFESKPFIVKPSTQSIEWSSKESKTLFYENEGMWSLRTGEAKGRIIGANLCTFNLLQGTQFMPSLKNCILFIEDTTGSDKFLFDRDLQSLLHQPHANEIKGIVIGRLSHDMEITKEIIKEIISTKEIGNIPILANVDFGHTNPIITFPIGGTASLEVKNESSQLRILKH